jgi:diguanylate cyclase
MQPLDCSSLSPSSLRVSARLCLSLTLLLFVISALGCYEVETAAGNVRAERHRVEQAAAAEALAGFARTATSAASGERPPGTYYFIAAKPPTADAALRPPPFLSSIEEGLAPALQAAEAGGSRTAFIQTQGGAFAAALTPYGSPTGRAAAVALIPLDQAFLKRLATRANVTGLHLASDREAVSRPTNLRLSPALTLVWSKGGLNNQFYALLGLGLAAASALFAYLATAHARRVAERCVANEAIARRLAGQDLLSGLANRMTFAAALDAEIARASRKSANLALLYIDLDGFKEINDYFGHDAGDKLIVAVGQRIASALRAGDRVARLGGDEFAVMLPEVLPRDAEIVCKRLFTSIRPPFELGENEAYVNMSIGVAVYPRDAVSRDELLRLADLALYRAKNEGRGRYAFFESHMGDELRFRRTLEEELRLAIERDQLTVAYQAIFAADAETIVGAEALVRWPHPERGLISPCQFIGLAEDRGLIASLGEWVLRRACRDANRWPGLKVAVNVSPIQFRSPDFVGAVERVLRETHRSPDLLELELTESVIVENADSAEEAMIELRAMGVTLALDDFGTGYSSLIYLRRFPFDKIKIDRCFLEAMEPTGESAIIVESIVSLGRALGLTVTAEGIETEEQKQILQSFRCHEFQGFGLAQPLDAETFGRFLEERAEGKAKSERAA